MKQADLECLKARIDKLVDIETSHGEKLRAKVLSVFEEEDNADLFYEVVSSSTPEAYIYPTAGGYSLPLSEIVSVKAVAI